MNRRNEQILKTAQDYVSGVTLSSPSNVIHFEAGAKWADKNPNSRTIAEYLYKEKGYPISLNGDIPTYEEVVKHVQAYNNYKMRQKTCDGIESTDAEPNLKSLWHDASEEPQGDRRIICVDVNLNNVWHDASDNRFYDDVINGKWIKFSDACPEDFNLDWVLVQFVEKSGFVGLPFIAEFDKSKNIWRLQGQESDNTSETYYINNDCIPSSWKIIENSPEWEKRNGKE